MLFAVGFQVKKKKSLSIHCFRLACVHSFVYCSGRPFNILGFMIAIDMDKKMWPL